MTGRTLRRPMRVYANTSVFGGVFDAKFEEDSLAFFAWVREGLFDVVISPLVSSELEGAPKPVRDLFANLEPLLERVDVDDAAYDLRQAYLDAGVVSPKRETDALHVAIATVSGCRAIVRPAGAPPT